MAFAASAAGPNGKREAELAERQKDMDADLAALKKRLELVPGNIGRFRAELQKIRAAKGINGTGVVFGPDFAMQAMAENRKIADNCATALIQFSRQLKERGVDLIVVPYIGHAEVYGHRLYEGGKASDELWPAKVEGLINLLENDVEVIECGDAFKAYKGKGSVLGHFDHHFGPAGIDIVARELGRRIRKRYDFAKAAGKGRRLFTSQEIQMPTPTFFLNYNGISADEAKSLNIPPTIPAEQITYNGTVDLGTRIDPVFVMGDSSVPFGEGKYDPSVGHGTGSAYPVGWGIMSHLSAELGWLVPYTSDHWGGHKQLEWYARSHAMTLPQPRVLILIMTGYSLNWTPEFTVHPRVGGWNVVDLPPLPAASDPRHLGTQEWHSPVARLIYGVLDDAVFERRKSTMNRDMQRIPVRLSGEPGVRYRHEPLTFGVPFADGSFPAGTALRCVTADGRELPLQTAEVTTWKPDLKHVKWLLVDVQADPAVVGETVFLEYPAAAASPEPEQRINTSTADGILTVDTGVLRLKLRTSFERWRHREYDSPVAGCQLKTPDGWRDVLHGPGLLLYMKDQHGNLYTSIGACPAPRVTLEEKGPLRVCVLITGHLTSAHGVLFCPYRLRIHLYAGKADMRIFHTFIFNQDPTRIELAAVGLKVFTKTGDEAVAVAGGESGTHFSRNFRTLSLLQTDDLSYAVRLDGAPFASGGKAAGWAAIGGADASVIAAVRDFWQEYPKGFSVSRDALDICIWPEDTPHPLRFITPFDEPPIWFNGTRDEEEVKRLLAEHPTAPLALKSFEIKNLDDIRWVEEIVERLAPGRAKTYCDFMGLETGVGAAKTTEVALRFAKGPIAHPEAAAFAAAVQEPLVGIVDPAHLCATRALGHFLPAGHPLFTDIDRNLDEQFEQTMIVPKAIGRLYGMMLHGQMLNGHTMYGGPPSGDLVYQFYRYTEPDKALRYLGPFNNESLDQAMGVWGQFLRTGRRRDLRQAQVTGRAIADVSFIHACPEDQAKVGCIHYHGAHVWSAGPSRSHSEVGFMMADYYLTGNRRMLEVALEAADGILYDKLEPCGIVNCFAPLFREFTAPLAILLEAYQATWHEKYGEPARRSLNWLLRTVRTPGWLPRSVYTGGPRGTEATVDPEVPLDGGATNPYHVFEPAFRLFPSKALSDFLVAYAERACRVGLSEAGVSICMAYDLTEKPEYAAAALAKVREHCQPHTPEHIVCFYDIIASDFAPRLMSIAARAWDKDPEGFMDFARQWREKRAQQQETGFDPAASQKPGTNLGPLSTEPFERMGATDVRSVAERPAGDAP